MDEPALSFEGVTLSPQKETVRVFYMDTWNHADKSLMPQIFHEGFSFRSLLGPTLIGHEQFAGYVDWVTGALGNYTTDILTLIEEGNRVSGKMRFRGFHRKEVFGVPPTGKHVWWTGMPIFTFDGGKVRDLYVLGDIHGLIGRLQACSAAAIDGGFALGSLYTGGTFTKPLGQAGAMAFSVENKKRRHLPLEPDLKARAADAEPAPDSNY